MPQHNINSQIIQLYSGDVPKGNLTFHLWDTRLNVREPSCENNPKQIFVRTSRKLMKNTTESINSAQWLSKNASQLLVVWLVLIALNWLLLDDNLEGIRQMVRSYVKTRTCWPFVHEEWINLIPLSNIFVNLFPHGIEQGRMIWFNRRFFETKLLNGKGLIHMGDSAPHLSKDEDKLTRTVPMSEVSPIIFTVFSAIQEYINNPRFRELEINGHFG